MQKMEKMLCLALALVMVLAMTACGGSDKPAAEAPAADAAAPTADDTVYTLNFYHIFAGVGHEQQWIQKAIEEVEAQSKGHKVETMADCDGLRIRIPSSDVYQETVAAWGCSPTAMSSAQVITSLANGTIEGFESDPASITARGQQESFKYY